MAEAEFAPREARLWHGEDRRRRQLHGNLEDPPLSLDELLVGFARIGLVKTVAALRRLTESGH